MKKTISICLTVFLAILLSVPAFAADTSNYTTESVISPKFTYIWSISAGLDISSTGKAHCSGSVDASGQCESLIINLYAKNRAFGNMK